jgi:hypothetical protein
MRSKGCTPRQMAVADACYANDFGCSLEQLGLREMIEENRCWNSGGAAVCSRAGVCTRCLRPQQLLLSCGAPTPPTDTRGSPYAVNIRRAAGSDCSLQAWMCTLSVYDSVCVCTCACARVRDAGETYLLMDRSMGSVVAHLAAQVRAPHGEDR